MSSHLIVCSRKLLPLCFGAKNAREHFCTSFEQRPWPSIYTSVSCITLAKVTEHVTMKTLLSNVNDKTIPKGQVWFSGFVAVVYILFVSFYPMLS